MHNLYSMSLAKNINCSYIVAAQFEQHVNIVVVLEKPFKFANIRVPQHSMNFDLCLKLKCREVTS
jgi:hypothetical protein